MTEQDNRLSFKCSVEVPVLDSNDEHRAKQKKKAVSISLDIKCKDFSLSRCRTENKTKKRQVSMFNLKKRVPDIIWSQNSPCDSEENLSILTEEQIQETLKNGTIVVILESPHREEYTKKDFAPRFPARGSAGKGIKNHREEVSKEVVRLIGSGQKCSLPMIVCNPVQYQASLNFLLHDGKPKKINPTLRNEVWNKLFAIQEIRDDFYYRINNYRPVAILNACTSALKWNVTHFLLERKVGCPIIHISHPSAGGWSESKRNLELVDPRY